MKLHFLKFDQNFTFLHFFQNVSNLFFNFLFMQYPEVLSSVVLDMILKGLAHDPGPWWLYQGLQTKSFLYWTLDFSFCKWKTWPRSGGWSQKLTWEAGREGGWPLVQERWKITRGMKLASHFDCMIVFFFWKASFCE